jgi:hypothetical protein
MEDSRAFRLNFARLAAAAGNSAFIFSQPPDHLTPAAAPR